MRLLPGACLALLPLVVPASAGTTTTARPSVALTASPAHVFLNGSGQATVRVSNRGSSTVVVDVRRAGFALDLRGRPKILTRATRRVASPWLTVRPLAFALPPGGSTPLRLAARVPAHAEPGDHDALVLLTTRPRPNAGVVVRMRLGIVVGIRAPGRIVHRLVAQQLRLRKTARAWALEVLVANRGNVTEELTGGSATLTLMRDGKAIAKLHGEPRRLLPLTRGIVLFRYRGPRRGPLFAVVVIAQRAGAPAARHTFRLRL